MMHPVLYALACVVVPFGWGVMVYKVGGFLEHRLKQRPKSVDVD